MGFELIDVDYVVFVVWLLGREEGMGDCFCC